MWKIFETRAAARSLDKLPLEILKRYEKWKDVIALSGPMGVRRVSGFKDEALKGRWFGFRSSRLNLQYRVIYKVFADKVYVEVFRVTPHDYR